MPNVMHVRLRPYNPLLGHVMLDWTAPWANAEGRSSKFKQGDWHTFGVDTPEQQQAIDYLRTVRQHCNDPNSKPAFDICTPAEARELIAREKQQKLQRAIRDDQPRMKAPTSIVSAPAADLNRAEVEHELELPPAPPPPKPVPPMEVASEPAVAKPRRKRAAAKRKATKKKATSRKPKSK